MTVQVIQLPIADFLKSIPALISERESLKIKFVTPNDINGIYEDGPFQTGDPRLLIDVATGGRPSLGFEILGSFLASGDESRETKTLADAIKANGVLAQSKVQEKISEQKDEPDIAIVYVSYGGFEQSMRTIYWYYETMPGVQVIALLCDCDLKNKLHHFSGTNGVSTVVISEDCGGRQEMKNIIDAFISAWSKKGS